MTSNVVAVPVPTGSVPTQAKDSGVKVVQKVTVTQGPQKAKPKTKKPKTKKIGVGSTRKEYSLLRKALFAAFRKAKKSDYTEANSQIKKIPTKERRAARKSLIDKLQAKLRQLRQQLPSGSKLKKAQLEHLISKAKTLKW